MSETYYPSSPESLATWHPASSSWRTSLPLFEPQSSPPYSASWPRSGMTRGGRLYELAMLVPVTDASACSLLPTPTASARNDQEEPESWLKRREELRARHGNNGAGMPLAAAMKLLPTPTATVIAEEQDPRKWLEQRSARGAKWGFGPALDLTRALQLLPREE